MPGEAPIIIVTAGTTATVIPGITAVIIPATTVITTPGIIQVIIPAAMEDIIPAGHTAIATGKALTAIRNASIPAAMADNEAETGDKEAMVAEPAPADIAAVRVQADSAADVLQADLVADVLPAVAVAEDIPAAVAEDTDNITHLLIIKTNKTR